MYATCYSDHDLGGGDAVLAVRGGMMGEWPKSGMLSAESGGEVLSFWRVGLLCLVYTLTQTPLRVSFAVRGNNDMIEIQGAE